MYFNEKKLLWFFLLAIALSLAIIVWDLMST